MRRDDAQGRAGGPPLPLRRHVPELDPRTWSALLLLTLTLTRRFLREGLVMRSLVWPAALTVGTLLATLGLVAALADGVFVAVAEDTPAEVVEELEALGWVVRPTERPRALVRDGRAWAGVRGDVIWTTSSSVDLMRIEAILRERNGAPWRPAAQTALPAPEQTADQGTMICRILAVLFALYGVVFGLGSVARDRDDGTLEAELSLPVPHWVPGLARWLAASAVLTVFFALCVSLFHAIIGVSQPDAMIRHGFAASGGAAAIGLMSAGRAGMKQGFSGPLAAGLATATGAVGAGMALPVLGRVLPLASITAGGEGWAPAGATFALGLLAAATFSHRSARS